MPFSPAPDTPPDHLRRLIDELRGGASVYPPFNLKLRTPELLWNPLQAWVEDAERRSRVPRAALGAAVAGRRARARHRWCRACTVNAIDFHRPPWEVHLIEGLEGGRFAIYVKVHHALVDGYTAMKIARGRAVARSRAIATRPLFFSIPPRPSHRATRRGEITAGSHYPELLAAVRAQSARRRPSRGRWSTSCVGARGRADLVSPLQAPRCDAERAHQPQPPLRDAAARDRAPARGGEGRGRHAQRRDPRAVGGGLRAYLLERDALPATPLVAMLPVERARRRTTPAAATRSARSSRRSRPTSTIRASASRASSRRRRARRSSCRACRRPRSSSTARCSPRR